MVEFILPLKLSYRMLKKLNFRRLSVSFCSHFHHSNLVHYSYTSSIKKMCVAHDKIDCSR